MNLLEAKEGKYKIIKLDVCDKMKNRLMSLGIMKGSIVKKLNDEQPIVKWKDARYVFGDKCAKNIEVE